nr:immunoglobulin heavy chain junction region [Mus musculus]
CARSRAFDYW